MSTKLDSAAEQTTSERLRELGIDLPEVAAPVAAYVPAQLVGETVRTSGQLPFVNGELPATGKVSDISADVSDGGADTGMARSATDVATGAGNSTTGAATSAETGAGVSAAAAKDLARQCALNALAAAAAVVGIDKIVGVQHLIGFVASDPGFTGQPGVINGASELFGEVFGAAGAHTRSAVGVAVLPMDAPVEIEVIFRVS